MGLFKKEIVVAERTGALTAAAVPINVVDYAEAQKLSLTRQPWQPRAWSYYDDVGEIHYGARFVANAISKIRLFAAERKDLSDTDPQPANDKQVTDAVGKLRSERGGQSSLLRQIALNIFVSGEGFMLGQGKGDKQDWEVLSINELMIRPGERRAFRIPNPVSPPEPIDPAALIIRAWSMHPRFSALADSPMRSILDECEKLLLLTRADKAAARSRFAGAGLLFIPNELMPVPQQPTARSGDNPEEDTNPVYTKLIESMITPIKDETHPSSVVPITIFGPAEHGKEIKHLTFERTRQGNLRAQQERLDTITRIATALDLPAEILLGKANVNHWTAWQIHEETFQQHLQPFIELICDALTVGYLKPAMKRAGIKDKPPGEYIVWYDDTDLVVRPDKGQTAIQLNTALVISDEATRRETGFTEKDKMPDDEYAKKVGVLLMDEHLAMTGEESPVAPVAPGPQTGGAAGPSKPPGVGPTEQAKNTQNAPGPAKTKPPGQPKPGQQPKPPKAPKAPGGKQVPKTTGGSGPKAKAVTAAATRSLGQALAQQDVQLMTQLRAAADEVLHRALERAGARVRSAASKNTGYQDLLKEVPNEQVASVLGPAVIENFSLKDQDLLKDAFAGFSTKALSWFRQAQRNRNATIAAIFRERVPERGLVAAGAPIMFGDPRYAPPKEKSEEAQDKADAQAMLDDGYTQQEIEDYTGFTADDMDMLYGEQDRQNRERGVGLLIGGLMAFAIAALYNPNPDQEQGETDDLSVPARLIRDAVEAAGGGGDGLATGSVAEEMLTDHGVPIRSRTWVYGPAMRKTPFLSHENLDGVEFTSWDDSVLEVGGEDDWLDAEHYHPGDHLGCLCATAPVFDDDTPAEDTPPTEG